MASTAAEARFRVDYPNALQLESRVIALDDDAAEVVCRLAEHEWSGAAHFLTYQTAIGGNGRGEATDATLHECWGSQVRLSDVLSDADATVMVATTDSGAQAAAVIGNACAVRGVMTTGLVLGRSNTANATLASLRPFAMVLASPQSEEDLMGILSALRV